MNGYIPADEPIASIAADGAYDTRVCHQKLLDRPAEALIPPRANAVAWPSLANGQPGLFNASQLMHSTDFSDHGMH